MKVKILAVAIFALFLATFSAPAAHAALTEAQIQAILGLLNSFGADQSVVNNVNLSLRGQPTAGGATGVFSYCPQLTYNLYLGIGDTETGGQVSQLQKFLAQDSSIYSEGQITGFFGPLTEQAVKKFQAKYGIVSSGSSETTGYGVVGARTREEILKACGGGSASSPSAPIIGVIAPETLKVGELGTFIFSEKVRTGKDVNYEVQWGDATVSTGAFDGEVSFAKSYSYPGEFLIIFKATNSAGLSSSKSVKVNVVSANIVVPTASAPTINSFTASPAQITSGQLVYLSWSTSNTNSNCGLSDTLGMLSHTVINTSNQGYSYAPNTSTTYTLACTGGTNTVYKNVSVTVTQPTQPTITLLSPNGGETWQIGSTQTIRWNSSGINKVSIWLCKLGICGRFGNIPATGISNVGSYTFTVDTNITPFGAYTPSPDLKIRVANEDDYPISTIYDDSNASFSIVAPTATQPSITVYSPNGGETWYVGQTYGLGLTYDGLPADGTFDIYLLDSAGSTVQNIAQGVSASALPFMWTVPSKLQGQYKIYAQINYAGIAKPIYDTSKSFFSIVTPTLFNPPAGSLSVSLDSASPPYRELVAGSTNVELARIKYSATGEDIYVRQVALQLSDPSLNQPDDLFNREVSIWDTAGNKIGATSFAGDYAVSANLGNSFLVPKDGSKTMILKGGIAQITPYGPLLFAGDLLKVDYDGNNVGTGGGNYGQGIASDSIIVPMGPDTASAGVKIVLPSITLLSLNGGEELIKGQLVNITWNSKGYPSGALAQIQLRGALNTSHIEKSITESINLSLGSYNWTVPSDTSTGQYYIWINGPVVGNSGISDFSDKPITISPQVQNCVDNDSGDPYTYGSVTLKNSDGSLRVLNDFCRDLTILNEYSCTAAGEFLGDNYACPNGCSNGACIKTSASSGSSSLNLANIMSAIEGLIKAFSQ